MKKLFWILLLAVPALGQNVRFDAPFPSVSSANSPYLVANIPPNSPTLAVCHSPANAVPCTNYATTFTSTGAACSNGAQDTPQPQPSACQSTGDAQGNIGFWAPAGTYDYTVCVSNTCFGPYTITLGGSIAGVSSLNALTGGLTIAAGANVTVTPSGGNTLTIASSGVDGGGTPGNPTGSLQGNNTGAFAGIPNTAANFTTGRVDVNNQTNVRWVTPAYNWSVTPGGSYTGGSPATLTFTNCPLGVTGSDTNLWAYVSGGTGTAEAVDITGGTCTPGLANGTLTFTPANSHSGAFTVSSASTGIYEALKDATATNANNATLILGPTNPPNGSYYAIYAPVTITGSNIEIDGKQGAMVDCEAWQQACFVATSTTGPIHIHGFRASTKSTKNVAGGVDAAITNTACAANVCTITSTFNPVVGSTVVIAGTGDVSFWGPEVVTSSSGSQFTYACTGCSKASQATPGGVAYEFGLVDTNANGTHIDHIAIDSPSGFQNRTFNNLVVVRNDQDFHLSDVTINSSLGGCDANYCSNGYLAPGPFSSNAAVSYIDHYNVSLGCSGNGITNYAGNTLHVSDTIIQGFSQWAVATGTFRGGFGPSQFDNVYTEVGSCTNPLYPGVGTQARAQAGLLVYGGRASVRDGEFPIGQLPQFANSGNGGTRYNYFLVVNDSGLGHSVPLYCGYASVDSVTPTGSITVTCPRVQGTNTVTYDLLRTSGVPTGGGVGIWPTPGSSCPGGSTSACGSILTAQAQQSTTMLTFTDTASASTSSYTIQQANYYPFVPFLPGAAVLLSNQDANQVINVAQLQANSTLFPSSVSTIFAEQNQVPSVVADFCGIEQAGFFATCASGNSNHNNNPGVVGTLYQAWAAGGVGASGLKGRLNFPVPTGVDINATHLITLVDSNSAKTLSSPISRPAWDANDTYIGLDQPIAGAGATTAGMSLGAPVSISEYIANTGDNSSWVTRTLTGSFAIQGHLNQQATKQFAGSCAMVAGTSCTFTLAAAYNSTPMCVVSPITTTSGSVVAGACSVSGTTVTITAAGSNSLTWNAILVGNPN